MGHTLSTEETWHLEILERVRSEPTAPAFLVDFGELHPRVLAELLAFGLIGKARKRRWGGGVRTGYWITPAGRAALQPEGEK